MIIFELVLTYSVASYVFEAAGAVGKIESGLKLKHHSQTYLAQIGETHCMTFSINYNCGGD